MGLLVVCFAALVREAVAVMAILVVIVVATWIAVGRVRLRKPVAMLGMAVILAVGALQVPNFAFFIRDQIAHVEPARFNGRHGMAHTLYIGLGAVPNRFGIAYHDLFGYEAAKKVDPNVEYVSDRYMHIVRDLYLQCWKDDPLEVVRIHFEKFKMVMDYRFLDNPHWSLWTCLILVSVTYFVGNGGRLSCSQQACEVRLGVSLVALAFIGLVVLQSMVAIPTQYYAMPIGPPLMLLVGVSIEGLVGGLRRAICRRLPSSS